MDQHSISVDPDPAIFSMGIRILRQPYKICKKKLYTVFIKTKKIDQKLKTMELINIYFFCIKEQLLLISLHFFIFFSQKFPPLDPDSHIECG